jgi:hypothetical protein
MSFSAPLVYSGVSGHQQLGLVGVQPLERATHLRLRCAMAIGERLQLVHRPFRMHRHSA